jgi:hypothetical protein
MIPDSLSKLIIRYTGKDFAGKRPFNMIILKVLYAIDGRSTIIDISKKLHIEIEPLKKIIKYLYRLGLLEFVEKAIVDVRFLEFISDEFTNVVGPVASLIIEETIESMGYNKASFPKSEIIKLVQNLALECDQGPEKETFIQTILEKLTLQWKL